MRLEALPGSAGGSPAVCRRLTRRTRSRTLRRAPMQPPAFQNTSPLDTPPTVGRALRERNLVWFVASRFFSGMAMTLLRATFAWQIFAITGSAFHLGLVGLVQFLPNFILSLVAGAIADTYDRRRIVMLSQAAALLGSAALFASARSGSASLSVIYAVIFAAAVASSFEGPARAALLPTLVPRPLFPSAVTLHSAVQNLAWVTGPLLTGFIIAAAGVSAAYLLNVGLIAVGLSALACVHPGRSEGTRGVVSLKAIGEGVAFVRKRQAILGAMTLDMFAVIFAGATALLPIYANDILRVGARGYGLLSSALEIGTVLMSGILLLRPHLRRPGRALLWAVAVYGIATIVFGLSRSFPLSLAAFIVAGMADQVSMVTRAMIIQLSTPDELRGRVSSVNLLFIGASNQLGAVESGFVAALTTATFSVVSGGLGCLLVLGVVAVALPGLRRHRLEEPLKS
jgi:MFS family permease